MEIKKLEMVMLFQEKKNFSLNEHVEHFSNSHEFTDEDLKQMVCLPKYYPTFFNKIYSPNKDYPTKHITNELELYSPNIHNEICVCKTQVGKIYFDLILANPCSNIEILNLRQKTIQYFASNYDPKRIEEFKKVRENIEDCLWFFKPINEHSDYVYNMIYYNKSYFKFLNKTEPLLTISNAYKIIISPIVSVLSPLMYVLIPFVILRIMSIKIPIRFFIKMMWDQSGFISLPFIRNPFISTLVKWFSKGLSIFLYFQNIYSSYNTSKTTLGIVNFFQKKMENIRAILGLNSKLVEKYSDYIQPNPKRFQRIQDGEIYNGETSLFSNKGRILKDFYEFIENKAEFLKVVNNIGFIDCYIGITEKLLEKKFYSVPELLKLEYPKMEIEGLWHPAVEKQKIVKNSIFFDKKKRNYILTGPNAAGKSTFIKGVFMNIYLAQTIGICNSDKMVYTPFSYFLTGIRNQDSQGSESLFEAEVHKIRDYLESIKKTGFTFSILDEVFTSTNYQEGFAASYGLCKTIGEMKNSLHIVATHFTKLYKIVKEKNMGFRNVKFSVVFNEKDEIEFPYKLEKGYSKQFIALRLMKQKHCDDVFLKNCIKYL
jgi:hypothetical protein